MTHDEQPAAAVAAATNAVAAPAKRQIALYSNEFFLMCAAGGALSCGLTHAFTTPLDLVKCRKQVDPKRYKGIIDGWKQIGRAEGLRGLYTGWGPTMVGYGLQGTFKFGLYEYFKYKYSHMVSEESAYENRTYLYLAASASAEVFADVALCPLEAIKVRMQTSDFAKTGMSAASKIYRTEGFGSFYKGIGPLWGRQIPYTMMKFASFERTVEAIYKNVLSKKKEEYNKIQQLGVTTLGGYIAGIFCAVVSHPADVLVSQMNNVPKLPGEGTMAFAGRLSRKAGFMGLWTGLGPRIIMVGTLTSLQWLVYDGWKAYLGLPTSGGKPTTVPAMSVAGHAMAAEKH